MLVKRLEEYVALLEIRQAGQRRAARVAGGTFLVSLLGTAAFGLVGGLSGRSAYLAVPLAGLLGLGYAAAWMRFEITRQSMELVETIRRAAGEKSPGRE